MLRRLAFNLASSLALFSALNLAHAQLPAPVMQVLQLNGIAAQDLGVMVLRGDETVLAHGATVAMQPASTIKVVTTLVGLERLGPVFRGRTELRSNGAIQDGVLRGDLVLKGGADADLSGAVLQDMLRALRYQGVRHIDGNLVLDRGLFLPARQDVGVAPFDESPDAYYNVIPDALLVNKNLLQLDMRASARSMTLQMHPLLERVGILSEMTLIDVDCARWEEGWKLPEVRRRGDGRIDLVLRGTFPKNCNRSYSVNVLDRDDYVERLVRQAWQDLGGTIGGKGMVGTAPLESRVLAAHAARTLPEIVRDINKLSDNTLARTLFLSLGSLQADPLEGSMPLPTAQHGETTFARADGAIRDWMRSQRIDDTGFVIENGSGLSRVERISAQQMAQVLQAGLRSQWAPEFQASLPIAALEGTMRRRLQGSPAAGRARLKTGSLRNVIAVAGYMPDANGNPCVVVAMVNSARAGDGRGRAVLDALVDWVARSGATAVPSALAAP